MKSRLEKICSVRGFLLSIYWRETIDGHFYKETISGIYECRLCGYRAFSYAKSKVLKKVILGVASQLIKKTPEEEEQNDTKTVNRS